MEYVSLDEIIKAKGLRLVLVQGMPSPWGQAAKTMFEMKGVPYMVAPQIPGAPNDDLVAWSGQGSGPVVAWEDEAPINHWLDILFLAERIAPAPSLIPKDVSARALMIGLSHEICGELGIGWSRRLMLFRPAMEMDDPPDNMKIMAARYRYDFGEADKAAERTADIVRAFAKQLASQKAKGSDYLVGQSVTALDVYWVAFMNLLKPYGDNIVPIPPDFRPGFEGIGPVIEAALDDTLIQHRDAIFSAHFRSPMEY
jgi:glutathione S-transferase